MEQEVKKGSPKTAYILGIVGVVVTLFMAIAVIYYWEWVRALEGYGYLGAFLISILGGATIIMFGTVAASGIRIIASSVIDRRGVLIMAISLGLGLGVAFTPEISGIFPQIVNQVFGSAITTGGLTAIFLNVI